jgi:hypothetical protein
MSVSSHNLSQLAFRREQDIHVLAGSGCGVNEIVYAMVIYSVCKLSQSQSHITTDGQSVCLSWCRAPSGAHDQIFVQFDSYCLVHGRAPSLTKGWVCLVSESVNSHSQLSVYTYIYIQF